MPGDGSRPDTGPPAMWVVKLGGSLNADVRLIDWLEVLAGPDAEPVVVVPGGGAFADAARAAQARWPVDDVSAHNMAVLGMAQTAQLLHGLQPRLVRADDVGGVRAALATGHSVVWHPLDALRAVADETTSWDVTADSLALRLAQRLGADGLALVKSCAVDATLSWAAMAQAGVVDRRFAAWAPEAKFPIELYARDEAARWPRRRPRGASRG